MGYVKKTGKSIEYQGESFGKSLTKDGGLVWGDNEIATYKLFNQNGDIIDNGTLTRDDKLTNMTFIVGKTVTTNLHGVYRLLVYLSDTVITEMNYVIAEYRLDYRKSSARND